MTAEESRRLTLVEAALRELTGQVGALTTSVDTLVRLRGEQHADHAVCRAEIDREFDARDGAIKELSGKMDALLTWGRVLSILGGLVIAVLGFVVYLQQIGIIS